MGWKIRGRTLRNQSRSTLCGLNFWIKFKYVPVLGASEKLQKATLSFMSAYPSVCLEQHGFQWTDFHEI
jgi:hypothetical protein